MIVNDLHFIFNRALSLTFSRKKLLFTFVILALCGLLVVFFRGLGLHAGSWVALNLTFMSIFLSAALLLSSGIILIRIYHDEVKKRDWSYREVLSHSWELLLGSSYFSLPIILLYLVLWMVLGVFVLLSEIPGVGALFAVVLSFAPFLLNFCSLLLCLLSLSMLFFVAPVIALNGFHRSRISMILVQRVRGDVFSNILLAFIALLPLLFSIALLLISAYLTGSMLPVEEHPMHQILYWFFLMIPFTAILSPAVVFFFNFAAESHVLMQKALGKQRT